MVETKRVLILTADAGFGHRVAANAIAAALAERYGQVCTIDVVNPLNEKRVPPFLRRAQGDYDRIVRQWPELYRFGYQANDKAITGALLKSSLMLLLYEAMRRLVKQYQPDVIVCTYPFYQASLAAYFVVKNRYIPLITVITDLVTVHRVWFHRRADLCLVPTAEVAQLAARHDIPPDRVKIVGIPVHPRFAQSPASKATLRAELGWDRDLITVLAVGSKRVERMARFLRPLNHSGLPIQLAVVAGGDDGLYQRLQQTEWHVPTHLYNFVDNMHQLMHASDCIISKAGGLTVTESLACGLPMLLIEVIPGQETGNAQYVTKAGAGELVEKPVLLLETLFHWLMDDCKLLKEKTARARDLGQPDAAYQVADIVWEAVQWGPRKRRWFVSPAR